MTGPLMLIVIGLLFLLNNLFPGQFSFGRMWPVILIVIGLVKVVEYFQGQAAGPRNPNTSANSSNGPLTTARGNDTPFNTRSEGSEKKEGL